MKINFSRHAKRRMKLYNIDKNDVIDTLNIYAEDINKKEEEIIELLNTAMSEKYKYPLKVVCAIENDTVYVITAYPLKRGRIS
ncbi:MAG: DUF4258 domain-containing protein [candidate division WOR-3 bacterium]